ncbi:MAG: hypothetical protein NTX75_11875 [Proteobacteria bacterium]|nr:hypothetical protein [Pseudomonadota bacterium]
MKTCTLVAIYGVASLASERGSLFGLCSKRGRREPHKTGKDMRYE